MHQERIMNKHPQTAFVPFFKALFLVCAVMMPCGCRDRAPVVEREKVTICAGSASGIPTILAKERGIFRQNGLDVTVREYITGLQAFEGLFAGECEIASCGETPMVLKSFERRDFSILATLATSEDATRIVVSRKSGIRGPHDIKGKRVFFVKKSINHFFIEMFLTKNGLSMRDITQVSLEVKDATDALKKGTVDAFASTDVILNRTIKALGEDAIVLSSPGLCLNTFNLAAMNTFIGERPALIRKVLNALVKTDAFMRKEPHQTIKTLSAAMNIDEPTMAEILGNYQWKVGLDQTLLLALEYEARWAIQNRLTTSTTVPNYLDFIHADALRSLVPEAVSIIK
jgi:NitT/TauT family transport system substrate-binding protein